MVKRSVNGLILGAILTLSTVVPNTVFSEPKGIKSEISRLISSPTKKSKKKTEYDEYTGELSLLAEQYSNGEVSEEELFSRIYDVMAKVYDLFIEHFSNMDYNDITIKDAQETISNIEIPFQGWKLIYKSLKSGKLSEYEIKLVELLDDLEIRLDQYINHMHILADRKERAHFLAFYNGTYEGGNAPSDDDTTALSALSLNEGWS